MGRNEILLDGLDKNRMIGVEIGPFYAPIAAKKAGWRTLVVDFTDTNGLKNIARTHSSEYIKDRVDEIENVDIVWTGQDLSDVCLRFNQLGYDYLLASHVIEHMPNFLGFLNQTSKLLKPTGILSLAVPDMRRCFDVLKLPSSTGDVLAANREKRIRHSPEKMFEAWAYSVGNKGAGAWISSDKLEPYLTDALDFSWERYLNYVKAYEAGTQDYIDAHSWYFTPSSFKLIILELNYLGLSDLHISRLDETIGAEFLVQLRRGKIEISAEELKRQREDLMTRRQKELLEVWQVT